MTASNATSTQPAVPYTAGYRARILAGDIYGHVSPTSPARQCLRSETPFDR